MLVWDAFTTNKVCVCSSFIASESQFVQYLLMVKTCRQRSLVAATTVYHATLTWSQSSWNIQQIETEQAATVCDCGTVGYALVTSSPSVVLTREAS